MKVVLNHKLGSFWVLCVSLGMAECAWAVKYYVDANVSGGSQTGLNWVNAFDTLQEALNQQDVTEVWVADGEYRVPTQTGYFELESSLFIYGGFASGEDFLHERDLHTNEAILSGDVANDDDPNDPFNVTLTDDNAFHVVNVGSAIQNAWIDGFTISGGNAVGLGTGERNGGGMRVLTNQKITIANITFKHNFAKENGGGLYYTNGDLLSALVNCTFIGNETDASGGGAYIEGPIEQVTNCSFAANVESWKAADSPTSPAPRSSSASARSRRMMPARATPGAAAGFIALLDLSIAMNFTTSSLLPTPPPISATASSGATATIPCPLASTHGSQRL